MSDLSPAFPITEKAYAKLNISLDVTARRADGYHDMLMIMQTVSLCDELTITPERDGLVHAVTTLPYVPGDRRNLAVRAALQFLELVGDSGRGMKIAIRKNIPVGAGMAGGSTDAAAVLKGLAELYESGDSEESLCATGVRLGADVPFCIRGGTMLAEGIGEKLSSLPAPQGYTVLLVKPPVDVPTGEVYKAFDALKPQKPAADMAAILKGTVKLSLTEGLYNDLAAVTEEKHPFIAALRAELCKEGAAAALMSGSGPTVFGLYTEKDAAEKALRKMKEAHPDCFCCVCALQGAE